MNGVTSRRRRQRVCSKDRAREGREGGQRNREGEGEREAGVRLLPAEVRPAPHRRALAPLHHLPVSHQSGVFVRNAAYTAVGARRRRGENGKILLHQMWTQTAGVPDYIRNA